MISAEVNQNTDIDTIEIKLEEITKAIHRLRRRKATGLDEIPMEFFKEMDEEQMEKFRQLLNIWWTEENLPDETLMARVVLIFKKGDTNDLSNCRPLSLLSSMYKILTCILQQRIEAGIDKHIQKDTVWI